jgi:7,8-dihydropterin-6-yl-methyl-4-(beta-D-ribofuranosyl)aminobenzene 5'-phosphate synthase
MPDPRVSLREVDEARVTIVVDNSVDVLLPSTPVAQRFALRPDWQGRSLPIAEHGFSALIEVKRGDKKATALLDTGGSPGSVLHNFDALGINPAEIHTVILSHGHFDHTLGLPAVIDRIGNPQLKIVMHPDVHLERKTIVPNRPEITISVPADTFRPTAGEIIETTGPLTLEDDMILISGEIARTTDFEKGFPIHHAKRDGVWQHDPLIMDDQCVVINVKNKGLVIVTGCGHSGIVNTIRHSQDLTGVRDIYAVVGGFHLTGGLFETIIPTTIEELEKINPRYLMPAHCTGWPAVSRIAEKLPEAFIVSSVGTTLVL